MIDHLSVAVSDLERAAVFYDGALTALGYARLWTVSDAIGYGEKGRVDEPFAIRRQMQMVASYQALHIAFTARVQEDVNRFYAAAMANGGRDDGPPGVHTEYAPDYYAAFVIDPDGNRIEAVHHSKASDLA